VTLSTLRVSAQLDPKELYGQRPSMYRLSVCIWFEFTAFYSKPVKGTVPKQPNPPLGSPRSWTLRNYMDSVLPCKD